MFDSTIDKLADRLTAALNILFTRFMDELIAKKRVRVHIVLDVEDKKERVCICGRKIEEE